MSTPSTIQGINGNVSLPTGFGAKIAGWSADLQVSQVDTTGFADAGYHTFEPTSIMMSGSCQGTGQFGASGTTPAPGSLLGSTPDLTQAKGTLTLTATTGCTYSFTAVFSNVKFQRNWAGKLDVSFDFQSSGPITQTWAVS